MFKFKKKNKEQFKEITGYKNILEIYLNYHLNYNKKLQQKKNNLRNFLKTILQKLPASI